MGKIKGKMTTTKINFFSSLHNKGTSDRNYKHALRAWNTFNMKEIDSVFLHNMKDVSTSLAVDIDFMKNMNAKLNLHNACFVFMGMNIKNNQNRTRNTNRC